MSLSFPAKKVNMTDRFELYEFFVEGKGKKGSHVLLHISEPSQGEHKKGYFFAVCEIEKPTLEQIEHLQTMIDDIESGYYETADSKNKEAFENTLEFMNRRSQHILDGSTGDVHCFLGVIQGNTLTFAMHGDPFAFVFYKKKQEWKRINLTDSHDSDGDLLFSTVTEGNIAAGDHVFVASPHVASYIDEDRIEKLLDTKKVRDAAAHMERTLQGLSDESSFGGLFIHPPKKGEAAMTGKAPKHTGKGSKESLEDLVAKQAETAQTLAPPMMKTLKAGMKNVFGGEKEHIVTKKQKGRTETNIRTPRRDGAPKESAPERVLIIIGKALVMGLIGIYQVAKTLVIGIGQLVRSLFLLISNHGNQRERVLQDISSLFRAKQRYILELPILSKVLFLAAIILAVVFISSISVTRIQENRVAEQQQYNDLVAAINDKKDAAEASLIYSDDGRAFTLLQEAQVLVDKLPTDTRERRDNAEALRADVDAVQANLRRMNLVEPTLLADLTTSHPNGQIAGIERLDDTLVVYSEEDSQLYTVHIPTSAVEAHDHSTIADLRLASTPKEEDTIIFLTGSDSAAAYNPDTSGLSARDIAHASGVSPTAMVVYNTRLYSLSPDTNQIYRHSPIQTGFGKGTEWITAEDISLAGGRSLAVDGDIFVLTSDTILKFAKGEPEDFTLLGLDPLLEEPTQIWTYNDVEFIYILEPTHKRVIMLDKTGKLVRQYTSTLWNNPTGMSVDEEKQIVYIVDSNKVYSFKL